jgi:threonine/homoserine/homoserine lactone efflux protein
MISFLTTGTILGLSAGFAPGPLLALVISETVEYGVKAGVKVALAPIITDLPIIIITLFILAKLSSFHSVLGVISIIGAIFILYMGIENIRIKGVRHQQKLTQIVSKRDYCKWAKSPSLFILVLCGWTDHPEGDGPEPSCCCRFCFELLFIACRIKDGSGFSGG